MRLRPFSGLVPASNDAAARVVSPPYDVVSAAEARAILDENPDSFMGVVRPDVAVPQGTGPYADLVYKTAAENLRGLVDRRVFVQSPAPGAAYVYEQSNHVTGARQRGLVALVSVEDYDQGVIKKHENTRPDKEDDRTRLAETLGAQTGPVFLTYRDVPDIDAIVDKTVSAKEPLFDVAADDNVRHRVWRVADSYSSSLVTLFETRVPVSYIADGHHRTAAAARVARQRLKANHSALSSVNDDQDSSWFLAVLFPESHLTILPYNRVVHDLNGSSPDEFIRMLEAVGRVQELDAQPDIPPQRGIVYLFVMENWYSFSLPKSRQDGLAVAEQLDCSVLQSTVLGPLLDIDDPRTSTRIEFVGGSREIGYLEKRVRSLRSGVAFVMHPVSVQDLMQVSDSGGIMPPKSTWFEPKLRSGFFVHKFI